MEISEQEQINPQQESIKSHQMDMYRKAHIAILPSFCGDIITPFALILAGILCGMFSRAFTVVFSTIEIFSGANFAQTILDNLENYVDSIYEIVMYTVVMTVPFIMFAWLRKIPKKQILGTGKPSFNVCLAAICCALGISVFASYFSFGLQYIMETFFGLYEESGFSDVPFDTISFILQMISVSILPALLEEFCYRGVMFAEVSRLGGTMAAILVTSVVFAVAHESILSIPLTLIFGLFAAWLRGRYDSLYPPMLAHFAINFTYVIYSILYQYQGEGYYETAQIMDFLFLVLGMAGVIFLFRTNRNAEGKSIAKQGFCTGEVATKTAVVYYFTSATMVAYLIYEIYMAVTAIGSL